MRMSSFYLLVLFLIIPNFSFASVVPLQNITLRSFATAPPPAPAAPIPALHEEYFSLEAATNFSAVERRLGGLTQAQKQYLEEHRFLLIPQKEFFNPFPGGDDYFESPLYDEMLYNFDSIGGSESPEERKPERAVLLNPDVFLQALHTYFSQRLKTLEKDELSASLELLLSNLYANAKTLGEQAGADGVVHWQRLQAQLVVPLLLLKNCAEPQLPDFPDPESVVDEDTSDTLANALEFFTSYSQDLSPALQDAVKKELELVYAASGMEKSHLFLLPTYGNNDMIDYTQFRARGHYESDSLSRAYFRAMIWLGQIGWDLQSEQGLMDSLNFALAMSYDGPEAEFHRGAWQQIMEISSFFVGYPDVPSYPEWQSYLAQYSGTGLTAKSCVDAALLQILANNLEHIPQPQTPFASLQEQNDLGVLTVFPQRFTIPWLITDRLTYQDPLRKDLPVVFSGLWVPALLGSAYAQSLLPQQVEVCLSGQPNTTAEGAPVAVSKNKKDILTTEVEEYRTGLQKHMATLASALKAEKSDSWFSSIGSAWLHLLGTLTADYEEGFPLYMRDAAFGAKQLETFMGAFTALKHDTILYEKPNYAELGGGWDEGEKPAVPKGFVEPNLPFWQALLRTVHYMEEGFRKFSLYPNDLEEYGALGRFKAALELCVALSEKELRGQPLTEAEYEDIRLLKLQYMAEPINMGNITSGEAMSGLVVDIQTANLDAPGAESVIVYEALAAPYIMLALVGNEDSPRVVTGMAYNHLEFITPYGTTRLTDGDWKKRVYGLSSENEYGSQEDTLPLPVKNFWYESLQP